MIQIDTHDSIPDIIIKIRSDSSKSLLLHIPFWHSVLHNATALKVIQKNTSGRHICIKTSDITARKIGEKLGISYRMTHKQEISQGNISITAYIYQSAREYIDECIGLFQNHKHIPGKKIYQEKSKIGLLLFYFGITLLLFLFIFYFAVSKTYITITPEISIKNKGKNLVFRELPEDEILKDIHVVKVKKISKQVFLEDTFAVQWVAQESVEKSSGTVKLYNMTPVSVPLLRNSRLETISSSALFTIPHQVTIPAATSSGSELIPGSIMVDIIASVYNSSGNIVGSKWNITDDTLLVFPWLASNRDQIFARSVWDFSGWNDTVIKKITRSDINNGKKLLEERIKKQALNALKEEIANQNKISNVSYNILDSWELVEYGLVEIRGEELIAIGEQADQLTLSATVQISAYVYNKDLVISRLNNFIKENTLDDIESILYLNEDSLRVSEIIYQNKSPFELKGTTQIEVFYVYNFLNRQNDYLENFKSSIAGLPKSEAIKILLNNPRIQDVQIETRPFFVKNVSSIDQNIIFKVED